MTPADTRHTEEKPSVPAAPRPLTFLSGTPRRCRGCPGPAPPQGPPAGATPRPRPRKAWGTLPYLTLPCLAPSRPVPPRTTKLSSIPSHSTTASTCSPVQTHGAAARTAPAWPALRRGAPEKPGAAPCPERSAVPPASGAPAAAAEAGDPAPVLRRPRARSHSTCSIVCPLRVGGAPRCPSGPPRLRAAEGPFSSLSRDRLPTAGLTELPEPSRGQRSGLRRAAVWRGLRARGGPSGAAPRAHLRPAGGGCHGDARDGGNRRTCRATGRGGTARPFPHSPGETVRDLPPGEGNHRV